MANASTNALDWANLECSGRVLDVGILIPGNDKTIFDVTWPNSPIGKITFVDDKTRKPYSTNVSFIAANEQIQSGKCHHLTIRILSYDKAEVVCE